MLQPDTTGFVIVILQKQRPLGNQENLDFLDYFVQKTPTNHPAHEKNHIDNGQSHH